MFEIFWHDYLYTPLLNFLVLLYNGPAGYNLGLAIIYLTLILRLFLLPLTIISERKKNFYTKLVDKIKEVEKDYKNDPVKQREIIRGLLKENRIKPWAKVVVLGVQLLVLVLLYQAFLGGIALTTKSVLYPWVIPPDFINTNFLTIDIAQRNFYLTAFVCLVLFLEITWEQSGKKEFLTRSDLMFRILFPPVSFLVLSLLPAVKSLFILTSILFTLILMFLDFTFFRFRAKV